MLNNKKKEIIRIYKNIEIIQISSELVKEFDHNCEKDPQNSRHLKRGENKNPCIFVDLAFVPSKLIPIFMRIVQDVLAVIRLTQTTLDSKQRPRLVNKDISTIQIS